jgi:predicted permease
MWQDLRYSARTLAQSPGFTTIAVLTLALGIGANTVIFSLIETLAFRPLPVADANRLVHVVQTREGREGRYPLSMPDYRYYREHASVFDDLAAHYSSSPINFVGGGESREVNGSVVTANYFDLLQLHPAAGRFFTREEDEVAGGVPVAIISYDWWRREFDRDPQVIGRSLQLNGTAFVVVGVAPEAFRGVFIGGLEVDVWIPSAMFGVGYRYCDAAQRDCRVVKLLGRLKADRTLADAQNELSVLSKQLQSAYPDSNKGLAALVLPAAGTNLDWRAKDARAPILLAAAVGFVLLIACANVAGLLLARGVARRGEIAIRLALGAGRWRLTRQLLTESVLLALIGGAAGLMVAVWAKDLLLAFYTVTSEGQRAYFRLDLDLAALAFTFGVSIFSALVFGMLPALQASRPDVLPALKDEGVGGAPRSRARDAIVIAQVALSLVLLVGAGLLARSLAAVYRGPGFDPRPVALLRLRPGLVGQSAARAKAFQAEVIRRLEALPGVVAASPADMPPLPDWGWVRPALDRQPAIWCRHVRSSDDGCHSGRADRGRFARQLSAGAARSPRRSDDGAPI